MKTKLEMAHDYLIKLIEVAPDESTRSGLVSTAWNYADLMQAEADKRENKETCDKSLNIDSEELNVEEWQPDWSKAPDDATAWEYLGHNSARWHTTTKGMYKSAELFGFSGMDMLILERPN